MAYMNQERKAKLAPRIKAVCRKYGVKATVAVRHHSTLVVNIREGKIDFAQNHIDAVKDQPRYVQYGVPTVDSLKSMDINPYWFREHFTGKARAFLVELFAVMNDGNHDNSNAQIDYFDVGWYNDVNVGKWNKPYVLVK